ncbi:MAG: hypothetical protein DIU78_008540 [Pseudomonadota bacterium]
MLGYLKWSKLVPVPQLGGRTLISLSEMGERVFALAWLVALAVLVGAALLRMGRHEAWWMVALVGVLISQCLIVVAWSDAKFGTIANASILVAVSISVAQARFGQRVDAEARALLARGAGKGSILERAEIGGLPLPVQKWLVRSGVVGRERARTVRLKQRGDLRTKPGGAWMPARAEQYFSVEPPAFLWKVDTRMAGVLPIVGRDEYVDGRGNMLIKAAALVSVVDAADEKIDHGSMLRFLGEMVWFPSAATSPYVAWEAIDDTRAKATMRSGGSEASAVFTFDAQGRVVGLRAERYLGGGAEAALTPWVVSCSEYRRFEGVEVPSRGEVGWELASGYFAYYRWEILEVQFDRAELYEHDSDRERGAEPVVRAAPSRPEGALP